MSVPFIFDLTFYKTTRGLTFLQLLLPAWFALPAVFCFCRFYGHPAHVCRHIGATNAKSDAMINDVTLAWPLAGTRSGAGMLRFKLNFSRLAALNSGINARA